MLNKLFCNHRHTIHDHPSCFASGNVNEKEVDKLAKEQGLPWYQMPEYKIGYLDIEADGLNADFNTMLSWCIKEKDGNVIGEVIKKKDLFNGTVDYNLVSSLVEEMKKYKILVGYYSTGYDLPFIRAKALHYGIDFPEYGSIYHFDLYYTVKSKLALSHNSLDAACSYLGIKGKTPLDREVWRQAKYGDPYAIAGVLEHNEGDVRITEELHNKLTPFRKWLKKSI